MFQCDLCNEHYHREFIAIGVLIQYIRTSVGQCLPYHGSDANTSSWWICDFCIRSRRPRLQDIVKLLGSLQKLTVRLPEGEILQCLTERAITWQEKAE
jgi:[histone H3]-trimethyl-L-lysine4 demethylase